jgi:RNA polymerase sigma factor (TIGR02999 family)
MSDVTVILSQIERGDRQAAEQLLPVVYDELRKLAAAKLAQEKPGQTLQATALVHEAYVRLVSPASGAKTDITGEPKRWSSSGHFFSAAAEAMRRILVEHARHKRRLKRGGDGQRLELSEAQAADSGQSELILAVNDSLTALAEQNAQASELVKLRYFGGLTLPEAAAALDVSPRTADRLWAYAKAFLHQRLQS